MSKLQLSINQLSHGSMMMCACAFLCVTGCTSSDHRISLDEYVSLKRESLRATQPTGSEALAAQTLIDQRLSSFRVGPDDVLTIMMSMLADDLIQPIQPFDVRVDTMGFVDLPIVGKLQVMNLTLEEFEDKIKGAYVPAVYLDLVVHVALVEAEPTNVLVRGAVTDPGFVNLRRTDRNIIHAINVAGGVSEIASGKISLRRVRQPRQEVELDLTKPQGVQAAMALSPLEDGDMVYVHAAAANVIFVGGLVNIPKPYTFPPGAEVTVLQALAASGGLRTDVTPTEATLIHRLSHGEDVHVKLDLERLRKGDDSNITLAAGDILWVPDTALTRTQEFINQNIFLRAGITVNYDIKAFEDLHSSFDQINQNQRDFAGSSP